MVSSLLSLLAAQKPAVRLASHLFSMEISAACPLDRASLVRTVLPLLLAEDQLLALPASRVTC